MSAKDILIGDLILTRMLAEARKELGSSPASLGGTPTPKGSVSKILRAPVVKTGGIITPNPGYSYEVTKRWGMHQAVIFDNGKEKKRSDWFFSERAAKAWGEDGIKFYELQTVKEATKAAYRRGRR